MLNKERQKEKERMTDRQRGKDKEINYAIQRKIKTSYHNNVHDTALIINVFKEQIPHGHKHMC